MDSFDELGLRKKEVGGHSAIPIAPMSTRFIAFKERFGKALPFWESDLREYGLVEAIFSEFEPEAIVHLGECPSAPYSMIDVKHAVYVQNNNINTTFNILFALRDVCPNAHLVKLNTMGEYGTPNTDIPEGFLKPTLGGEEIGFLFQGRPAPGITGPKCTAPTT